MLEYRSLFYLLTGLGRFMIPNDMIVCRHISEEEALSTLSQHKAIKALVLGDDEIIASESEDVGCWSYIQQTCLFIL